MARLFGTDGIRGEANRYPMDGHTAFSVGQAATYVLGRNARRAPQVIIGRDTRVSGHMLEHALAAGVTSMGGVVRLAGVLPTPAIAFLTVDGGADVGAVISASHNPFQDNGIKLFSGTGFKLTDEQEDEIERPLERRLPRRSRYPAPGTWVRAPAWMTARSVMSPSSRASSRGTCLSPV